MNNARTWRSVLIVMAGAAGALAYAVFSGHGSHNRKDPVAKTEQTPSPSPGSGLVEAVGATDLPGAIDAGQNDHLPQVSDSGSSGSWEAGPIDLSESVSVTEIFAEFPHCQDIVDLGSIMFPDESELCYLRHKDSSLNVAAFELIEKYNKKQDKISGLSIEGGGVA